VSKAATLAVRPLLLLGPWGGAIADRFELRPLLLFTQTLFGVLAALLWLLALLGDAGIGIGVVIAITVAGGLLQVVDSPARQAFVSALVPANDLASAVSLNGVVMNSARVVGPALAGLLIVTVGTTAWFAVNAASYLAIVGALILIRPLTAPRSATREPAGVRAGIVYARQHQQLWLPLAMMAVVGLLAFNFSVLLPVFAKDTFHGSGATYGLMLTSLSIGSIVGSQSIGFIRHPRRR
jgi:MFS family permease